MRGGICSRGKQAGQPGEQVLDMSTPQPAVGCPCGFRRRRTLQKESSLTRGSSCSASGSLREGKPAVSRRRSGRAGSRMPYPLQRRQNIYFLPSYAAAAGQHWPARLTGLMGCTIEHRTARRSLAIDNATSWIQLFPPTHILNSREWCLVSSTIRRKKKADWEDRVVPPLSS